VSATTQRNASVRAVNPELSVYYKGEHQSLAAVDDARSLLRFRVPGPSGVSLSKFEGSSETLDVQPDRVAAEQRRTLHLPTDLGAPVQVDLVRSVAVREGAQDLSMRFQVAASGAPLETVRISLRPTGGVAWGIALQDPEHAKLDVRRFAEPVQMDVRTEPPGAARIVPFQGGLLVELTIGGDPLGTQVADATIVLGMTPVGQPRPRLQALTAEQALDTYDARFALLRRTSDPGWRASAASLGFEPVYTNPSYILYERGGAA
jgi:hypothetical protein